MFKNLNPTEDTVTTQITVTNGFHDGGVGTLAGSNFTTASLSSAQKNYYYNIQFNSKDHLSCTYGHIAGSGSSEQSATVEGTTQAIYNSIRSEENIFVRDMGRVQLKNIKEPERAFKIYTSKGEYNKENSEELTNKLVKADVNLVDRKAEFKKEFSIGITYIKNLGSEENEFFCYGITQDLILETSKISKIKVSQIDQILKYKETDLDVEQIAKKLNSEYIYWSGSGWKVPRSSARNLVNIPDP